MDSNTTPHPIIEVLRLASQSELAACEFLEARRWGDCPACVHCGSVNVYKMSDAKTGARNKDLRWRCRDCDKMYSIRSKSVLEETRLPLRVWVHAFWSASASKKGISALQIKRECGISYQSALFLMHRVRLAMGPTEPDTNKLSGTVEADETYVGGKPRFDVYHREKWSAKTPVFGVVQRKGDVRYEVLTKVNSKNLRAALDRHVKRQGTRLMTDQSPLYKAFDKTYEGGHETVNHSVHEYVRGDVSSNTIESCFALIKRGIYGTFHNVSDKHLHRYLGEFSFKWNTRKVNDAERVAAAIRGADGKRLTYKQQLGKVEEVA
ncbi:MAG: IS1595 family transposase [Planctomycetes bacterium]|nr:IS1595 family transposase [Planctomycetota bacterium]